MTLYYTYYEIKQILHQLRLEHLRENANHGKSKRVMQIKPNANASFSLCISFSKASNVGIFQLGNREVGHNEVAGHDQQISMKKPILK